jgi:short-subunit dehydrogenase
VTPRPRHAVITGASSGIGTALARRLHRSGAHLTLVARRQGHLEALARELGDGCRWAVHDVSKEPTTWVEDLERDEPIDLFIYNAGIQALEPFSVSDPAIGRSILETNLWAPMALARAVIPAMLARRSGTLIQIASVAALVGPSGMAWYAAAKAGLSAFSETLRGEVHKAGIQVLTVYPGPIDNGAPQEASRFYGKRSLAAHLPSGNADDLAKAILRALRLQRARLIYPSFYKAAYWLTPATRWLVARESQRLQAEAE